MDNMDNFEKPAGHTTQLWLLIFSDLVTLLLVFFVMLYSMSELKQDSWPQINSALQRSFDLKHMKLDAKPNAAFNMPVADATQGVDLDYLLSIMRDKFDNKDIDLFDFVYKFDDRLVISLPHELLFDNNTDTLTPKAEKLVHSLVDMFNYIPNQIEMIGHSDPRPIVSGPYPSNWHLSLARALALERMFRKIGYQKPVLIQSVADSEFELFSTALPLYVREKMARKVDIIIHKSKERF